MQEADHPFSSVRSPLMKLSDDIEASARVSPGLPINVTIGPESTFVTPSPSVLDAGNDQLVEEIINRNRRQSYEDVAASLAANNPYLFNNLDGGSAINIKILYSDAPSETRVTSLKALLLDIVNVSLKYEDTFPSSLSSPQQIHSPDVSAGGIKRHSSTIMSTNHIEIPAATSSEVRSRGIPELRQRDLRRLERQFNTSEAPYMLIRRHCVLVSLGALISAVVQAERLILIVHPEAGNEDALFQLERHVTDWLKSSSYIKKDDKHFSFPVSITTTEKIIVPTSSFVVRAYEALFSVMHVLLKQELDTISEDATRLQKAIGQHSLLSLPIQEALRLLKTQIHRLATRAAGSVKMLDEVLNGDDEDRFGYYFLNLQALSLDSSLYNEENSTVTHHHHHHKKKWQILYSPELEAVLEAYQDDLSGLAAQVVQVQQNLEYVEQMVGLRLDISRNELLVASTVFSVVACAIGFGGFITGAFGMNLDNAAKFAPVPGLFAAVSTFCIMFIVTSTFLVLKYFRFKGILPTHAHWKNLKRR